TLQHDLQNGMPASSLKLLDASTGQEVRDLPLAKDIPGTAGPAVFSPDGSKLAFVDADGAVKVVETDTGKEGSRMMQDPKAPRGRLGQMSLAFSRDGRALFVRPVTSPRVRVWEVATGKELPQLGPEPAQQTYRLFPGGSTASRLMLSPDG